MDEIFEGCYIHSLQFKPLYHTLTIHLLTIDYMLDYIVIFGLHQDYLGTLSCMAQLGLVKPQVSSNLKLNTNLLSNKFWISTDADVSVYCSNRNSIVSTLRDTLFQLSRQY